MYHVVLFITNLEKGIKFGKRYKTPHHGMGSLTKTKKLLFTTAIQLQGLVFKPFYYLILVLRNVYKIKKSKEP